MGTIKKGSKQYKENLKKQQFLNQNNSTTGLLGIAFVVLKLLHVIEWSWIWVLAPFWIPVALVLAFAIIALIVVGLVYLKNNKLK